MSVPTLTENSGIYELAWKDEQLHIRIDRIHTTKTGVFGEILIRTTAPAQPGHIHGPVHFNLTSTASRTQLVKHLGDGLGLPWVAILEQACYKVVEAHRVGVPTIDIAGHEMPDHLGMRIAPILQEKQATVFFGDGDSLKSYLAAYLSVLTRLGQFHNGLSPEPGNVLYLDYETDADTFWERINMITAGMGVGMPDGIFYRHEVESVVDDLSGIHQAVIENDIALVVVDSAAPATVEPEKAECVIPFFRALRTLDATSITIAHQTKSNTGEYPFGSTFWRNLPRSNFHIKADRNYEDVAISLKHTKSNNGRRLSPMGLRFSFNHDVVEITSAVAQDYTDLSKDIPTHQRILHVLDQPQTVQEIADAIEVSSDTIRKALHRGKGSLFFNNGQLWAKLATE